MKRIISVLLALMLILTLTACGGNDADITVSGGENPNSDTSGTETELGGTELYTEVIKVLGNPEVTNVVGSETDPTTHMFRINDNGVQVRYIHIDALKDGEPVNIMQTSDFHFNRMSDRDYAENNPAVADTRIYRKGFRDESTVPNAKNVLSLADKFDAVAITGDNIDYLTWGSLDMIKEHIWDVLGDKVIMPLGGHDTTRVMESTVADTTTLESRYEILQGAWKHDIHYSNMIVKDRVMLVQMNNGQSKYYGTQAEKLAADIKTARENNTVILLFQHEPIATGDTNQARVAPITAGSDYGNFYKSGIGGSKYVADDVTAEVYKLITENGDVIRGVFCGHYHKNYYTEIKATYQKDGTTVDTTIPQIVLDTTTSAQGYITAINVD